MFLVFLKSIAFTKGSKYNRLPLMIIFPWCLSSVIFNPFKQYVKFLWFTAPIKGIVTSSYYTPALCQAWYIIPRQTSQPVSKVFSTNEKTGTFISLLLFNSPLFTWIRRYRIHISNSSIFHSTRSNRAGPHLRDGISYFSSLFSKYEKHTSSYSLY